MKNFVNIFYFLNLIKHKKRMRYVEIEPTEKSGTTFAIFYLNEKSNAILITNSDPHVK